MAKKNLFRQSALDRLSNPEQLDTLMQVVSPQSWLALLGLLLLILAGLGWMVFDRSPTTLNVQGVLIAESDGDAALNGERLLASRDGQVSHVLVAPGDYVELGQLLLVVDGDDEQVVESPFEGLLVNLQVAAGDRISAGSLLGEVLPITADASSPIEVVGYVSVYEAQQIAVGMPVKVAPLDIPYQEYGFLKGTVRSIGRFPSTTSLAQNFMQDGDPVIEFRVALEPDQATPSGYAWSIGQGPDRSLQIGVVSNLTVIVETERPVDSVLGG